MKDITRELTMGVKDGFRDGKQYVVGTWWLWTSAVRIEDAHGLTAWVFSVGSLGYYFSVQFSHQDYRGG
jgi:hypothetical protein